MSIKLRAPELYKLISELSGMNGVLKEDEKGYCDSVEAYEQFLYRNRDYFERKGQIENSLASKLQSHQLDERSIGEFHDKFAELLEAPRPYNIKVEFSPNHGRIADSWFNVHAFDSVIVNEYVLVTVFHPQLLREASIRYTRNERVTVKEAGFRKVANEAIEETFQKRFPAELDQSHYRWLVTAFDLMNEAFEGCLPEFGISDFVEWEFSGDMLCVYQDERFGAPKLFCKNDVFGFIPQNVGILPPLADTRSMTVRCSSGGKYVGPYWIYVAHTCGYYRDFAKTGALITTIAETIDRIASVNIGVIKLDDAFAFANYQQSIFAMGQHFTELRIEMGVGQFIDKGISKALAAQKGAQRSKEKSKNKRDIVESAALSLANEIGVSFGFKDDFDIAQLIRDKVICEHGELFTHNGKYHDVGFFLKVFEDRKSEIRKQLEGKKA